MKVVPGYIVSSSERVVKWRGLDSVRRVVVCIIESEAVFAFLYSVDGGSVGYTVVSEGKSKHD